MDVTACLVTRGDVDLGEILDSFPDQWHVVTWNNAETYVDLAVYGRYAAIRGADTEVVYVQDDDCVLEPESLAALMDAYEPGKIVANMPDRFRPWYPDSCLVGFGAIFDRDLPGKAFARLPSIPSDYLRTCDVYFTALSQRVILDLPYRDLPWAYADNRMWKQASHVPERKKALDHARDLR